MQSTFWFFLRSEKSIIQSLDFSVKLLQAPLLLIPHEQILFYDRGRHLLCRVACGWHTPDILRKHVLYEMAAEVLKHTQAQSMEPIDLQSIWRQQDVAVPQRAPMMCQPFA